MLHSAFTSQHYLLKRQVLALTGTFRIYDQHDQQVLYSQQKMFRLREDIRVYSDEGRMQELLHIQARQIIDFSAAFDVVDMTTQQPVGGLRRKGLRSMMRDEWEIFNPSGQVFAVMTEDSLERALLRRLLLGSLLPQDYDVLAGGSRIADLRQRFNLLRYELNIDLSLDTQRLLDPRLALAGAILLAAIEGRQDS